MDLKVNYNSAKDKNEAYEMVEKAVTPEYIAKWKIKAQLTYEPDKQIISAKGKGFKLTLDFKDSYLEVNLDVSFLLRPLGKRFLKSINEELEKVV
jgi:hypothetical protein